jgi:hypothetical protein
MATHPPASAFVMHGARDACAAGLTHVEQQVRSIEQAVVDNPALAFDLARTLVESVCRTILSERKVDFSPDDGLPKLFNSVRGHLPFLPPTVNGEAEVRKSLVQTLNGLSTAIQGICELRKQCGFASHGSDKPRPVMESVQALMAAEAADTIVGFLYRIHRQDRTAQPSPRAQYDENLAFNEYVDETHGIVSIFDVELRPSQVLFEMEPESYRIYLAEFDEEAERAASSMDTGPETAA